MQPVYIFDAIRTPRTRAKAGGGLNTLSATDVMLALFQAAQERSGLDPSAVGDIVLGCVTQHGEQAGNIAKIAALAAGWPDAVAGITVNRYCSSGLDAINIAALKVAAGQDTLNLAGGIEMMSRVPMLADQATCFIDPATAARSKMLMMGSGADLIASLHGISREQADQLAFASQQKAAHARAQGWFSSIVPIRNPHDGTVVSLDECIREDTSIESLAAMQPAFAKLGAKGADAVQLAAFPELSQINHIHTPGNSPAMADAGALVTIGSAAAQDILQQAPRARIVATASACDNPLLVLTGCIAATRKLLAQQNLTVDDIDLFEIHEAFAATVLHCQAALGIADNQLNVNGGVIALGHPMGASGAIMAGTLLDELERRGLKRGLVAASGAAGCGTAMLIERV
jgi:acetyl-CoA C-acetyltransferase